MSGAGPAVGIMMGSQSDWETMRHAAETLDKLAIPHEVKVASAHRTPDRVHSYATSAQSRSSYVAPTATVMARAAKSSVRGHIPMQ